MLKADGRSLHEKTSNAMVPKNSAPSLGSASRSGVCVELKELKDSVMTLDLAEVESMKDVGVTK
jgi:hypothetical protein